MLVKTLILVTLAAFGDANSLPEYDTVIVGMGAAGCAAASVLCNAGKSVLALEAQNRVGGRVHTVSLGDSIVELGAEWIHGERPSKLYDLTKQNNISLMSQDQSFEVFKSDGSSVEVDLVDELVKFAIDKLGDPPEEPQSLGQFLTREINEYLRVYYPSILSDQEFVDQFLNYMNLVNLNYEAANSWNDVTTKTAYEDLQGDLHLSWHKYGYKTLLEILLNTYNNGTGFPTLELRLKKTVTKISYPEDSKADVVVMCEDGATYRAKNVIVTVSLGVLKERYTTLFSPPLPLKKVDSIRQISIGAVGKIILKFNNIWWDSVLYYAFLWRTDDREKLSYEDRWFLSIDGATIPMSSNSSITLWTTGEGTRLVESLPDDVVKTKSMELLRRFMGKNRTVPEPTVMLRTHWYSNPFTRGTYSFDNLETPLHPHVRSILAEPLTDNSGTPRVLFAGEATNSIHFSTVHGAMETGYREADRSLSSSNNR